MTDWQIPLLISAVIFAAFMVFRMRPAVTPGARAFAAALSDAKKRIAAAKSESARAVALADAADACARLGRTNSAVGFYLRAFREDPKAEAIVERAMAGLDRRPAALEKLMWRHLGAHAWTDEHRSAQVACLRALERAYGKRRSQHVRAQAITHLLKALGAPATTTTTTTTTTTAAPAAEKT